MQGSLVLQNSIFILKVMNTHIETQLTIISLGEEFSILIQIPVQSFWKHTTLTRRTAGSLEGHTYYD